MGSGIFSKKFCRYINYKWTHSYTSDNSKSIIMNTTMPTLQRTQGPVSITDKTAYCKTSWNIESREIGWLNYRVASKIDRHVGSCVADVPIKFRGDCTILYTNLTEYITRWESLRVLLALSRHMASLNEWDWRFTIPVVKGHSVLDLVPGVTTQHSENSFAFENTFIVVSVSFLASCLAI